LDKGLILLYNSAMSAKEKVGAIIAAAGEGQRMGGTDKVLAPLGGKPLLARAVQPFQDSPAVDRIVIVLSQQNMEAGRWLAEGEGWSRVSDVCLGGKRRQDSVLAGLERLKDCQWVIVHDGVRPLVNTELIERGLAEAGETGAAIAAVPAGDTIKVSGEDKIVHQTPPRQNLWVAQTPQVFRYSILAEAYQQAQEDATDDASLVERLGHKVKLYMGRYDNIKITTPDDLILAEVLWSKREG